MLLNMENKKQLATILFSIGLGLVAAFLVSQYVQNNIKQQTALLATQYQQKNTAVINELELMKREMKKVAARQDNLETQQRNIKLTPAPAPMAQNEDRKTELQATAFSLKTPYGKRALTVMIDSLSAVGGLIIPGDFVDVMAHFTIKGEGVTATDTTTAILFQNVQVLAVGINYKTDEAQDTLPMYTMQQQSRALNVTIAVTPEEASLLTFVQANGSLQLVLRSPQEDSTQILQVASWGALADFVLDKQGTELKVPKKEQKIEAEEVEEIIEDDIKPFIQIFKSGRELSL